MKVTSIEVRRQKVNGVLRKAQAGVRAHQKALRLTYQAVVRHEAEALRQSVRKQGV